MPDQRGIEVLALPAGFSYVTFGHIASRMSDGHLTPLALDGMAAFPGPRGTVRLIRNHEDRNTVNEGSVPHDPDSYDHSAGGGTSTLDYDPRSRTLVRDFISLSGSHVNCAGGYGLHGKSWLTGEETVYGPKFTDVTRQHDKRHGYVFEVPLRRRPGHSDGQPLRRWGASCTRRSPPTTAAGSSYETEDPGSGRGAGFYRFLPRDRRNLRKGGRLQILGIKGSPEYDARQGQQRGKPLPVKWIDIDEPDPEYVNEDDPRGVFQQGWRDGACKFNRLEGCWWPTATASSSSPPAAATSRTATSTRDGYREGYGQIWEYRAGAIGGTLVLHYESPGGEVARLARQPHGHAARRPAAVRGRRVGGRTTTPHPLAPGIVNVNRLIGISPRGEAFDVRRQPCSAPTELAGVCFSPDGETLFVNLYGDSTGTPADHATRA